MHNVNNRDRPPRVELRPAASKVFSRTSLHKRSLAVTHNRYCIQNQRLRSQARAAAPLMFIYTIYCEATTHSALLETGIREIKTGHRDVTFDQKIGFFNLSSIHARTAMPVSYTHLTLPTNREV